MICKKANLYMIHITLHKKTVVYFIESKCLLRLETCIRAMLYKYRYKNKKDYYVCDISKIKKTFKNCEKSIECMEQTGGGEINFIEKEITKSMKNMLFLIKRLECWDKN